MGSVEETKDSRTVACTGWWWTLAVLLALALPVDVEAEVMVLNLLEVRVLLPDPLPPPLEWGTRRTPAPDREGSSKNDMRSLCPVERCSRFMCVEKSDQVRT